MRVLVEYNNNLKSNIDEVKKYGFEPVVLFSIRLNNKNQIRNDLESLMNKVKDIKYSTAVLVTIEKQDNSTVGTVNTLKRHFDIVIGYGGLNKINRFFLESTNVDFLMDPQNSLFKLKIDFIHHFNSGLNHVLCEYAKKKEIGFIFSLNFFNANKKYIPKEIGRINQNLRFTRKFDIDTYLNFIVKDKCDVKSIVELKGIYSFFDISTQQVSSSLTVLEKKVDSSQFKKSKKFVSSGIEFE